MRLKAANANPIIVLTSYHGKKYFTLDIGVQDTGYAVPQFHTFFGPVRFGYDPHKAYPSADNLCSMVSRNHGKSNHAFGVYYDGDRDPCVPLCGRGTASRDQKEHDAYVQQV